MLDALPARDGELAPGDRPSIRMCPVWAVAALDALDSTSHPRDCASQPLGRCTNSSACSRPHFPHVEEHGWTKWRWLGRVGLDRTCGETGLIAATLFSVSLVTLVGASCAGGLADGALWRGEVS